MISGKGFSECCKWVVDPRYPTRARFSYSASQDRDWVFINGDYIEDFLGLVPILSAKRYFVIIHNSDLTFTENKLARLRRYVYHIYAINTDFVHPRVTTIPIGFADKDLPFLHGFNAGSSERTNEIYMNFNVNTNFSKRNDCVRSFEGDSRVVRKHNLPPPEYYMELCRSKFVLCPEGTGIDTHRVYESLFCGATPVVLRNSLSHLYETLPVCIVDKWTDPFYIPAPKSFKTSVNEYYKS